MRIEGKMFFQKVGFVVGILLFVTCAFRAADGGDYSLKAYQYKGHLLFQTFFNGVTNKEDFTFKALVSGCRWSITVYPSKMNGKQTPYQYLELSYDSTNIYSYIQFSYRSNCINTSQAGISPAENPMPAGDAEGMPVWLALASSCYFDTEKEGVARDCWTVGDFEAKEKKNKIRIRRHPMPPHLPEFIEFFNDGVWRGYKGGQLIKEPYLPPLTEGFVHRVFIARNFQAVGEINVPMEFELQWWQPKARFWRAEETSKDIVELVRMGKGTNQEIQILDVTNDSFVPKTDGRAYTSDARFATSNTLIHDIIYLNTNKEGNWVKADSEALRNLYNKELQLKLLSQRHQPMISGGKKIALLVFMVALGIVPLLYSILRHKSPS